MDRGTRRQRTANVIRSRLEIYSAPEDVEPHRYAKTPSLACHCRKRTFGRPRMSRGICDIGCRDRIYRWRRETREFRTWARCQGVDWEDDSVTLIFVPRNKWV